MFLFCFYPWPYVVNVCTSSGKASDVFSIAVHVFRNLFWKICPLFGQILITCLKCSKVSFLPSSYIEMMRWGTDCFDSFYRISYFQTLHDSLLLFLELFKTVCRELCYYSVDQLNIVRKIKNKSKNLKNH